MIASRNIKFVEDKAPSNLAVVDICIFTTISVNINSLVNNTISKNAVKMNHKHFNTNVSKNTTPSVQISASVSLSTSTIANIFIYSTPLSELTTPSFVNNSDDTDNVVVSDIVVSKQSKAIIPLREPSTHVWKPAQQYRMVA